MLHKIALKLSHAAILFPLAVAAQSSDYDKYFSDSTLRIDYIFEGNADQQNIALSKLHATPDWFGRRHNLDRLPVRGNGRIIVKTTDTSDTIYMLPFSDLFLEWIVTDEAKTTRRAMEASYLIPMPKKPVDITVEIDDKFCNVSSSMTHRVDPSDILIKRHKTDRTVDHRFIHRGGDPKEKIDVAILAEGYTEAEMDSFYLHAEKAVQSILSHEPFKHRADQFNFIAVATPSKDSGVSIPRLNDWKETAFSSHYSTFYSDRYLTTGNVAAIHEALKGIPYEHLIILANTPEYGGGGIFNSYTLTTSRNPKFWPVVTHEFGHSFGALADEYFYETDVMSEAFPKNIEPWQQNVTTMVDFNSKWADMIDKNTPVPTDAKDFDKYGVGVYEGAAYSTHGLYRPYDRCRMRDNDYPIFCPVCQRALEQLIDFYTRQIE